MAAQHRIQPVPLQRHIPSGHLLRPLCVVLSLLRPRNIQTVSISPLAYVHIHIFCFLFFCILFFVFFFVLTLFLIVLKTVTSVEYSTSVDRGLCVCVCVQKSPLKSLSLFSIYLSISIYVRKLLITQKLS